MGGGKTRRPCKGGLLITVHYLTRRLLSLIPVILGVTLITFGLLALVPGDPAEILASYGKESEPTPEDIQRVREELGLDLPLPVRYLSWLGDLFKGDLGQSLRSGRPVWQEITARLPATLELATAGMAIGLMIALPVGILSAVRKGSVLDQFSRFLALFGASVPSFWLGAMLILIFAVRLHLLPSMGRGGLKHIILPAFALGLGASAVLMRLIRASLLEVLDQDFIRTARSKGLTERLVVLGHALKPALIPAVTVLGLQFGHLLGGAVILETIFAWPGLGMYIIESILGRDFTVIQGFALLMALVFLAANFGVDMIYRFLDPRIEYRVKE